MYERILTRMREKVRTRQYVMTVHAEEEMEDEGLHIYEIERGILAGQILERQRDQETGEWKYLVKGDTLFGGEVALVAKLSPTGKLIIITVYRL